MSLFPAGTLTYATLPKAGSVAVGSIMLTKDRGLMISDGYASWTKLTPDRPSIKSSILGGVPVGNESVMMDNYGTGNPATTSQLIPACNTRKRYIINRSCPFVKVAFTNFAGTGYYPSQYPLTITASFESSNGAVRVPFTFNGELIGTIAGSFGAAANLGGVMVSDPLYIPVTPGQQCWVWVHQEGPNPLFSSVVLSVAAWGEGCDLAYNVANPDVTLSGTVPAINGGFYAPIALVGDGAPGLPYVGLFGDSIGAGAGDNTQVDAGRGYLRRLLNNAIPFVNLCVPGNFYTSYWSTALQFAQGCTDCVDQMGINDISNKTLAQIQAYAIAAWISLGASGARVWKTTLTPYTSSTDSYVTAINQTPQSNEAIRVGVNTWLRGGAPIINGNAVAVGLGNALLAGQLGHPLTGIIEATNLVEVNSSNVLTQNGGRWQVGTVDPATGGIHPSSVGAAQIAAGINTNIFTAQL